MACDDEEHSRIVRDYFAKRCTRRTACMLRDAIILALANPEKVIHIAFATTNLAASARRYPITYLKKKLGVNVGRRVRTISLAKLRKMQDGPAVIFLADHRVWETSPHDIPAFVRKNA